MIIYYAGLGRNVADLYSAVQTGGCRHLMLSYHYKDYLRKKQITRFRRLGLHLFLDSGAFSAWTKGVTIDVNDYIQFIKDNHFGKYINLDVVGDPEASLANLHTMEAAGLYPIPVYHLGSDMKYLRQLVAEGYEYICLGGTVGARSSKREEFFDEVFAEFPNTFFHGLGMTDQRLILKYPWFSVDSTTWLVGRKYNELQTEEGRIALPPGLTAHDKIARNVEFFVGLEERKRNER